MSQSDYMATIWQCVRNLINTKKNGLAVLEVHTGGGKTHNSIQVISEYIKEELAKKKSPRKCYFLSPQLKNLPEGMLKKLFPDNAEKHIFLNLKANREQILEYFLPMYQSMPAEVKRLPECKELQAAIQHLEEVEKIAELGGQSEKAVESTQKYIEIIKDDITRKERDFRKALRGVLYNKEEFHELIEAAKQGGQAYYALLDKRFHWLATLYPAMTLPRYPLLLMSSKKFLYPIDPILSKGYLLPTAEKADGSVVFLDESDEVFSDFNDVQMEEAVKTQKNALKVFCLIHGNLAIAELPRKLALADSRLDEKLNLKDIRQHAEEIYQAYHLERCYRTMEGEQKDERCFIFQDLITSTIYLKKGHTHLLASLDDKEHRVSVQQVSTKVYNEKRTSSTIQVHSLLNDIQRFFERFCAYVNNLSEEYAGICNEERKQRLDASGEHTVWEEEMTLEAARNSVLDVLKMDETLDETFFNNNRQRLYKKKKKPTPLRERSYYQDGFHIFEIENSPNHQENTVFLYTARDTTPEAALCFLAKHCLVILISATAKWDTGNNYDLGFCRDILGEDYIDLNELCRDAQAPEADTFHHAYEAQNISVRVCKLDGEETLAKPEYGGNVETWLMKTFPEQQDAARRLAKKMQADAAAAAEYNRSSKNTSQNDGKYFLRRYVELFCPIHKFVAHATARAWLFLNTPKLGRGDGFREDIARDYIQLCCQKMPEQGKNVACYFLNTKKDYDKRIKSIWHDLAHGKRVMVFAAYKSISTGQNLQYALQAIDKQFARCIGSDASPDDARYQQCDFDGIVLGDMTHMLWMPDKNARDLRLDDLRGISEYEVMMERGVISQYKGREIIRSILKRNYRWVASDEKRNILVRRRKMRQLIQATGRISRAFWKRPEIFIYISASILYDMDSHEMMAHPLTYEQQCIAEYAQQFQLDHADEALARICNDAERKANVSNSEINRFLNRVKREGWDFVSVETWQKMRELALRYPTFDAIPDEFKELAALFYFEKPQEHAAQYFYFAHNDYSTIAISFDASKDEFFAKRREELDSPEDGNDGPILQEMSEACARLNVMLKFPGFREYMEGHGYATSFGNGRFIMTPTFYNNIYKGALGEAFCDFLFRELGYPLAPIDDLENFELFDFRLKEGLFVDAKNWSERSEFSNDYQQGKIHDKLKQTGGRVIIANIVVADGEEYLPSVSENVLVLPGLIDREGNLLQKNVDKLRAFVEGDAL